MASEKEVKYEILKEVEDEKSTVGFFQRVVEERLADEAFTAVLVGPAGVGKSTLVNTLIMRPNCITGKGAKFVTSKVEAQTVELSLNEGKGTAKLQVYDSPGFTGDDEEDAETTRGLQAITDVDLLLICFDITSDGGRYTPMREGKTLKKIVKAMGKEVVREKGLIVLTKANNLDSSREGQTDGKELAELLDFRKEHRRRSEKLKEELRFLGELEIQAAGRLDFDDKGNPSAITDVNGSKEWLNDVFNAAGLKSSDGLRALFYTITAQAHSNRAIHTKVKDDLPKPNKWFLTKVLLYGLGATALTAGVILTGGLVAGAALPAAAPAAASALTAGSVGEAAAALAGASVAAQAGGAAASAGSGILTSLVAYWKGK